MSRILVVEDDQMIQKVYRNVLTKEGHEVEVASDGREGLAKAEASEPDLIILDMLMPNMTGIEFLRAYDIAGRHPRVKVLAFSNTDHPGRVEEAMALGARKYMTKYQFSPKGLAAAVAELLALP